MMMMFLFDWKMSKSTNIALTRFGDHSEDMEEICCCGRTWPEI